MMDVTFVLEESGVTATVEVPCEADVAAAKEVACTALAVSPASVEMRIGTQVLEGTCRLQDTAFDAGVQVVLACPHFADIKCPAQCSIQGNVQNFSLSRCGTLCLSFHRTDDARIACVGFDTETFDTAFTFDIDVRCYGLAAISRCKKRCYVACREGMHEVALPGWEVLRKVDGASHSVFACGNVVVSKGTDGVSVYDENLTLLRSLSHEGCMGAAVSDCGGWVITSSYKEMKVRLWDVNTGEGVACVPTYGWNMALSRSASVFAVAGSDTVDDACSSKVHLYDWRGVALGSFEKEDYLVCGVHFTPCGKYVVVAFVESVVSTYTCPLHQYDVATMSCVRVIPDSSGAFAISPCSRVVVFGSQAQGDTTSSIVTRHLYPHNSE